jgi:glycosyltransferase involved in cell wall biosynthesis
LLVGRKKRSSPAMPLRPYATQRMQLLFEKGPLFYAEYNIRLFLLLLFKRADLLFSNDLDTLLPNYLTSQIKKIPLVYDSHEYFTETPELVHRRFVQSVWKKIEGRIFPKLTDVITVNESIAGLFKEKYNRPVAVVRNIPQAVAIQKSEKPPEDFPAQRPVILLQGSGINIQRGAEELILAMHYVNNAHLLIIGGGDVLDTLKEMAKHPKLKHKITFLPRMPFEQLMCYTVHADLGLTLDKDTNINYRYSLPNKLFDYINAGVPVLASPLVEIKKIIESYGVGETISSHQPKAIADHINQMLANAVQMKMYRDNCKIAARSLNWENEKQTLKEILKKYA